MREVPQPNSSIVELHANDGSGHDHLLRFDRNLLFALVYYRCSNSTGASVEIVNSNFHRYGDAFIPGTIVRTSNLPSSSGKIRHPLVFTIIVQDASVNDPQNTMARYAVVWPAHLQLFDARTSDPIDVGPVPRSLTDDDIRHQLAERRVHDLMLEDLASQRIRQALAAQPTTKP